LRGRLNQATHPPLGPWWLERQRDPDSPAYVTGGVEEGNSVGRTWTVLGTMDGEWRPAVDPAGLLSVGRGRPSIDWWVRAGDHWVFPSRHPAVRQRALDGAPVVETRVRVAGGDVVHRVGLARAGEDVAVVEITNETAVAVAVAVAVRPYDLLATMGASDLLAPVTWSDAEFTLTVAGRPLLRVARAPGQVVIAPAATDLAEILAAGPGDGVAKPAPLGVGPTQAALVFPLVATATLRVAVVDRPAPARPRRIARRQAPGGIPHPPTLPNTAQLAAGWRTHRDRLRIELPPGVVTDAFTAARTHLPLFGPDCARWRDPYARVQSGPAAPVVVLRAMTELGYGREARDVLLRLAGAVDTDGHLPGSGDPVSATAALVVAAADHWRLLRDQAMLSPLVQPLVGALQWLDRRRSGSKGTPGGLLSESVAPNGWALRAFADGADLLGAAGEQAAAARSRAVAAQLRVDLQAALDGLTRVPMARSVLAPGRPLDHLALAWPCRVLRPDHPLVAAALAAVRAEWLYRWGYHVSNPPRGWDVVATVRLAMIELALGDDGVVNRLEGLGAAASATMTWPSRIHPRLGTGSAGGGHDGMASASVATVVRTLLAAETADGSNWLVLLRCLPAAWFGQPVEVHALPTEAGRLSYAVRWHGDRPAVLWELEPHRPGEPVMLSAPGLDPSWSTEKHAGEALLAPVDLPSEAVAPGAGAPGATPSGDAPATERPGVDPDGSFT
jgi:hypothetical protein